MAVFLDWKALDKKQILSLELENDPEMIRRYQKKSQPTTLSLAVFNLLEKNCNWNFDLLLRWLFPQLFGRKFEEYMKVNYDDERKRDIAVDFHVYNFMWVNELRSCHGIEYWKRSAPKHSQRYSKGSFNVSAHSVFARTRHLMGDAHQHSCLSCLKRCTMIRRLIHQLTLDREVFKIFKIWFWNTA